MSSPRLATHRGNEIAGDTVRQSLNRRAAALRFARPCARSAPAAFRCRRAPRCMTKLPVPLTVPPVTLLPFVFSTGIGSPVIIDSSTRGRAFEHDAVDRNFFAGPHAQAVADSARDPAGRLLRCRRRACSRAVFGARPSNALIALPVWLRARSSSTWPSSTSTVITAAASK